MDNLSYTDGQITEYTKDRYNEFSSFSYNYYTISYTKYLNESEGTKDAETGVVEVIKRTKVNPRIKWIFVGGGNREQWLRGAIASNGLAECCEVVGRHPFEDMPTYYNLADVMFISLKATQYQHLEQTIPARLQSYMAAGKPIIGMIGEGVATLIRSVDCGICVDAGDYEACAQSILDIADNSARLELWGRNARRYYESHYTKSRCIDNLETIISFKQ